MFEEINLTIPQTFILIGLLLRVLYYIWHVESQQESHIELLHDDVINNTSDLLNERDKAYITFEDRLYN